MNIADTISKRNYIQSIHACSMCKNYEDLTWAEIQEKYPSAKNDPILKNHQIIFEETYKILQSVPDGLSF